MNRRRCTSTVSEMTTYRHKTFLFLVTFSFQYFRLHYMHCICCLLLQMSHVAWSVCLCVGHMAVLCKKRTDRDAVWGLTRLGPRNHVLDGIAIPMGTGNFWGCPTHWKALGVCCSVCSKMNLTILNNGTTCDAAFCGLSLTTCLKIFVTLSVISTL